MGRLHSQKASFAAGEISPSLFGRADLRAYENGAAKLRNVFLHPTGGVTRRDGMRLVDAAAGAGRLVPFEFNTEQVYLMVFTAGRIDIYRHGAKVADVEAPWSAEQLAHINWTQSADTLLVVHPDVAPKRITRTSHTTWTVTNWSFHTQNSRLYMPHHRFAGSGVTLRASATTGVVQLTASAPVFLAGHVGTRFRIAGKEVEVFRVDSDYVAQANVIETLVNTTATADWSEQAFSAARGWPVSVCFHQDRLVIGGSRDLPNQLWLSRSADLFNFDLGEGLDDEAIDFPILSDQVNAIRHVFSGRHLQVFTSGAEWMVTGEPLTPTSIQLFRQTRVGSVVDRTVPPRDVDGATLFVPRSGRQLREFLFADTEQAYQAGDLAMLASHVIDTPVDMAFDPSRRLLHLVNGDGTMATLTVYRDEAINGWTLQNTAGLIRSVTVVGTQTYLLVERNGATFIEVFDDDLEVDAGLTLTSADPTLEWLGAGHLEGQTVKIVADGAAVLDSVVEGGAVVLQEPARSVMIGLPFKHIIEPLPPSLQAFGGSQGVKLRPISFTFRVWETTALYLETGRGIVHVPFKRFGASVLDAPPGPFSGDVTVRALGWREGGLAPLWRIEQDTPLPFTLLSVASELMTAR